MKKIHLTIMLLLMSLLVGCVDQSQGSTSQTTNNNKKIVATSVATLEILEKLDVDNVVGIPQTTSYQIPEKYKDAQSIGSPMSPDMEIIKSLNPDIHLTH